MMPGREVCSDHHIRGLPAMRLNALHEIGKVLAGSEITGSDDLIKEPCRPGLLLQKRGQLLRIAPAGRTTGLFHFQTDIIHQSRRFQDAKRFRFHIPIDFAGRAARLQTKQRLIPDDIPSASGLQTADIDTGRTAGMAGDRMKIQRRTGRRQQGIFPLFRCSSRMSRNAKEPGIVFAGRQKPVTLQATLPVRRILNPKCAPSR